MPAARQYVYIHWFRGEIVETGTVAAAKALVLDRYPDALFAGWEDAPISVNMAVWAGIAKRLRFDLGEREDENRPIAYIMMLDRRLLAVGAGRNT